MRNGFIILCLLCIQTLATAQSTAVDSAELHREYYSVNLQASLNFHLFSPQGHQWYTQALFSFPEYNSLAESYRFRLQTGYELKASDHWRVGFGAKFNISQYSKYIIPRVSLAHHGNFAKLDFIKEFNGELTYNLEKNSNSTGSTALISGLIGLGKEFKIGESRFYTALSYKLYLYLLTKDVGYNLYQNRTFDHSQWRFDFQYIVNTQFRIGVYAIWDTDYFYTLGKFDMDNNPIAPDYRFNQITPILGLQLHYILKGDRREGYLPLWPSK